ncbi:paralemmin-3 isoform X2 [Salarias fasciatus]|uniref:paralemmin-3 isoform X2 n=1 Tax=Salarias fasciatus TaxID=181472 RepID=UPI001176DA4D|nr:paralemmin-3-like isoform X2 [Salarias fasciatus]
MCAGDTMDEAEKYKQRLEAIAEKRRLQEEEDKARREMEDEKLRLQQLKRKSLRDQWLMEGAALSPTSLDAQAPRSPSWDTHDRDMKKDADKLQPAEGKEKLEELTEEAVNVAEGVEEMIQGVVQNGQTSNGSGDHEESAEGRVKADPRPALDETIVASINGNLEPNTNHSASEQSSQSTTNGPIGITAAAGDMKLDQQSSADEPEPGQAPSDNINEEEEEEGTLVMRAECVIITDEGDDASQEDHQDETPLLNAGEGKEEEEAVEELVKAETFADSEQEEEGELVTGAQQPAAGNGDVEGSVKLLPDAEGAVEHEDIQVGSTASVQLQSSAGAPEGAAVAPVPVYSEEQPSTLSAAPQAEGAGEGEASAAPEGAEELACQPGQFQDVSLADPQENNRTEEGPGEREPLLLEGAVPRTAAEPAGVQGPASAETQSPPRAPGQADQAKAPKSKSCQCCSVM